MVDDEGAPTPSPAPEPPPPVPAGSDFVWEDAAAVPLATLVFLAGLLPGYHGQGAFEPLREGWLTSGLGLAALFVHLYSRGAANEWRRRAAGFLMGTLAFLLNLYVAVFYYRFHAAQEPQLGAVGHLSYLGLGVDLALAAGILLAWTGVPTRRPAPGVAPAPPTVNARLRWTQRWGLPLLVFAVAFTTYNIEVEVPSIIDFDEAHYVNVGRNMTAGVLIDPQWAEPRPHNFEHPPVGKYLIAFGYALFGRPHGDLAWPEYKELCSTDNPECLVDSHAWRQMSVTVGALGVLGLYWLGLRLFGSVAAGLGAASLLLFDGLYYLHSRIAMLDIFPVGFSLLAFGVLLGPRRWHPWAAGVLFGLACASKHPALFLAPVFLVLAGLRSPRPGLRGKLADAALWAVLVPLATYVLTYAPYFWTWSHMGGPGFAAHMFAYVHEEGFRWTYRAALETPHPYISEPWSWILMRRPVLYFVGYDAAQNVGHIYALGNPFTWWTGSVAILYTWLVLPGRWMLGRPRWGLRAFGQWALRARLPLSPDGALLVATLLFAASYGPFFLVQRDQFNFYFLLAAPFFALVLGAYVGRALDAGGRPRLVALAFLIVAFAVFVFFHPVVAGTYIPEEDFQFIMHTVPRMAQ